MSCRATASLPSPTVKGVWLWPTRLSSSSTSEVKGWCEPPLSVPDVAVVPSAPIEKPPLLCTLLRDQTMKEFSGGLSTCPFVS